MTGRPCPAPTAPAPAPARGTTRRRRPRWRASNLAVVFVAILGACVLMYPTAAAWFYDRAHHSRAQGYLDTVARLPDASLKALLAQARAYNEALPEGPIRDVFGSRAAPGDVRPADSDAYRSLLTVEGTDVMARLRIPGVGLSLPIYHGTGEDSLRRGVGHLAGSSLPVGGEGTHSVLTGHNGLVGATLFNDLDDVRLGDTFIVTAAGQDAYYRVDQIVVVLPDDTGELRRFEGHDYVTLITCTPTSINSHRLLVRGERVPAPEVEDGRLAVPVGTADPGVPWWILVVVGLPALTAWLVRPRTPAPRRGPAHGQGAGGCRLR